MSAPVDAVTFDFWDTLVVAQIQATRELRRAALLEVLGRHGHGDVTDEDLERIFDATVAQFNQRWADNETFTARDGALHVVHLLERDLPPDCHDELVDAFVQAGRHAPVSLTANIEQVLARLDDVGVRIGIICDVGMTPSTILRTYLDDRELLEHFDHWSFSDEVGAYKPSPVIFEHALSGLGVTDPTRVAHVGDLRRTDVAGARAMGMISVRYRGSNDDHGAADEGSEADHVIDDHLELLALLDLT